MSTSENKRRNSTGRKLSKSGNSLYETLGLQKGAKDDEIKRAYRKLALQNHPDKNPDNPSATERFKEINRANSILMDEDKRKIYDKYGSWGINIANQIGTDKASMILKFENPCVKVLLVLLCIFTGCCYCCFCYCFCCYRFCCGRCVPKDEDEEANINFESMAREQGGDAAPPAADVSNESNTIPVHNKSEPIILGPPPPRPQPETTTSSEETSAR